MFSVPVLAATVFPLLCTGLSHAPGPLDDLPLVEGVPAQPLIAQVERLVEALDFAGAAIDPAAKEALEQAAGSSPAPCRRSVRGMRNRGGREQSDAHGEVSGEM